MNKQILKRYFNLRINASGAAFENQSIGPNLSPYMPRDKINQFCLEFNNLTKFYISSEVEVYVRLNLYADNSFNFIIKGPSFPFLLKLFYNVDKISNLNVNSINLYSLYKLVYIKNYFLKNNLNKYLFDAFLKIQFRNLYYSIFSKKKKS